jgi:hypothetical protein
MMHSAKLDALIDRAAVMVVELASSWTMAEFQMALAGLRNSPMGKGQPFEQYKNGGLIGCLNHVDFI